MARDIYLALDEVHSESYLLELAQEKYPNHGHSKEEVHKILEDMIAYDLILREDNQYLSLALLPLDYTEEEFDMSRAQASAFSTQNAALPVV